MKAKLNPGDNLFRKAVQHDNPGIEPNTAIAERLNYHYTLKQPTRKLYANSFAGMFVWLLSFKNIGIKASFLSICLAYFLFVGNIKTGSGIPELSDTCQVHQLFVDTAFMVKDTSR